jgi:hypothetical protein
VSESETYPLEINVKYAEYLLNIENKKPAISTAEKMERIELKVKMKKIRCVLV